MGRTLDGDGAGTDSMLAAVSGMDTSTRKTVGKEATLTDGAGMAAREERGVADDVGPRGSGPTALLGCGGKESLVVLTCCWAAGEKERDGEEQWVRREERARGD